MLPETKHGFSGIVCYGLPASKIWPIKISTTAKTTATTTSKNNHINNENNLNNH